MRCRRLSHCYSVVLKKDRLQLLSEDWVVGKDKIVIARSSWRPPTDIYETDSQVYITAELAGMEPEDIDIALYDDALVVEGHRQLSLDPDGLYYIAEIQQGRFCLEILLPFSIDQENIEARYEAGLLIIILKKKKRERFHDSSYIH